MRDRDGGIFFKQHDGHRFSDNIASADDQSVGAGERIVHGFQHFDDAVWRAAAEAADAGHDRTDVDNMETVNVFICTDCLNDFLLVDMTGQGELYKDSIHGIVGIEFLQKC